MMKLISLFKIFNILLFNLYREYFLTNAGAKQSMEMSGGELHLFRYIVNFSDLNNTVCSNAF